MNTIQKNELTKKDDIGNGLYFPIYLKLNGILILL